MIGYCPVCGSIIVRDEDSEPTILAVSHEGSEECAIPKDIWGMVGVHNRAGEMGSHDHHIPMVRREGGVGCGPVVAAAAAPSSSSSSWIPLECGPSYKQFRKDLWGHGYKLDLQPEREGEVQPEVLRVDTEGFSLVTHLAVDGLVVNVHHHAKYGAQGHTAFCVAPQCRVYWKLMNHDVERFGPEHQYIHITGSFRTGGSGSGCRRCTLYPCKFWRPSPDALGSPEC